MGTRQCTRHAESAGLERVQRTLRHPTQSYKSAIQVYAEKDLMIKRTRPYWAPWAYAGALALLGATGDLIAGVTGEGALRWGAAATGTALAGLVSFAWRWKGLSWAVPAWLTPSPPRRRWAQVCLIGATFWLTAAFLLGLSWEMILLLAAATVLAARTHWATCVPALPPGAATSERPALREAPPEREETSPRMVQIEADWAANVATAILPGTRLEGGHRIDVGYRWLLHLNRRGGNFAKAVNAIGDIAPAINVYPDNILIEQLPRPDGDDDLDGEAENIGASVVQLTIVTRSPIRKTIPVNESRYECETTTIADPETGADTEVVRYGVVRMGPYADGHGDALWRVYAENGAWHGFILGGSRMGKSALLNLIAFSLFVSGHTVIWYIDGQGGVSSPFLAEIADWAADGREDWPHMLGAVEEIVYARGEENKKWGWEGFTPSPKRPGLAIIIDECHEVFTPEEAKRWEYLARKMLKVGVFFITASQQGQIGTFGDRSGLREAIVGGNAVALKVESDMQSQLIPKLHGINPVNLPPIRGYAYTAECEVDGKFFGRTAPMRGGYRPADRDKPNNYFDLIAELGATGSQLDPIAVGAAIVGSDNRYRDRHAIREENRAGLAEKLAAYQAIAEGADIDVEQTDHERPALSTVDETTAMPDLTAITPEAATRALEHIQQVLSGLSGSRHIAYHTIAYAPSGVANTSDVQQATGKSSSQVNNILTSLREENLIRKVGHGQYTITTPQMAAA